MAANILPIIFEVFGLIAVIDKPDLLMNCFSISKDRIFLLFGRLLEQLASRAYRTGRGRLLSGKSSYLKT